jgi:excisionase family DNA binding protein
MTDEIVGPALALGVVTFAQATRRRRKSFSVERHETTQYGRLRRLLTVPELCDTLRITRTTAYRLVNSGQLRAVIVGARIRFRPEDVDTYLERETAADVNENGCCTSPNSSSVPGSIQPDSVSGGTG